MNKFRLWHITILILGFTCLGCLQPISVNKPPVDVISLSGKIQQSLLEERQGVSALANQVALTPKEADQKTLWIANNDKIRSKVATDIAAAIKDQLEAAKTDEEVSSVWKEVAKGYGQ